MAIYKRTVTQKGKNKGKESFFKDGKSVNRALVPFEILQAEIGKEFEILEGNEEPTQELPPVVEAPVEQYDPETKLSVISGEPGNRRKWLNQRVYWLTEEEYNTYSLGKLAQAIREREEAQTVASQAE